MSRHLMIPVLASAFFISSLAHANTLTVCASGCDYTSINAAIDNAQNGDVIQLAAETYREGETIDTDGKAITLLGVTDDFDNPASILDGGNTFEGTNRIQVLACQNGEDSTTVFRNLLVQNGYDTLGARTPVMQVPHAGSKM